MFGFKNKERELYERLLNEKERLLVALADQVDWFRAQSGTYMGHALPAAEGITPEDALAGDLEKVLADAGLTSSPLHLGEDEEEIAWQLAHGGVDPETALAAMRQAMGVEELPFDHDDD